jgi:hypothetical protein
MQSRPRCQAGQRAGAASNQREEGRAKAGDASWSMRDSHAALLLRRLVRSGDLSPWLAAVVRTRARFPVDKIYASMQEPLGGFCSSEGPDILNYTRIILSAIAATVAYYVFGSIGGAFFANSYAQYAAVFRPREMIVGYMPLGFAGTLIAALALALTYARAYRGKSMALEGLRFGALIGVFVIGACVAQQLTESSSDAPTPPRVAIARPPRNRNLQRESRALLTVAATSDRRPCSCRRG